MDDFRPKTKKTENLIYVYGRNRKCTESPFLVIFGAENENVNEFRSVSSQYPPRKKSPQSISPGSISPLDIIPLGHNPLTLMYFR